MKQHTFSEVQFNEDESDSDDSYPNDDEDDSDPPSSDDEEENPIIGIGGSGEINNLAKNILNIDEDEVDIEVDDDNDDDDDEEEDEEEDVEIDETGELTTKSKKSKHTTVASSIEMNDDDEYEDDDDDEIDENYLHKFDNEIIKNYIDEFHPECLNHNYDEISKLSVVTRDEDGIIVDPLHKTIPFLTKYEKTKILGSRTKQIETGAKPLVKIPENIVDSYIIAELELKEKKIPFIIRRPIPGGAYEYWNINDLEMISF